MKIKHERVLKDGRIQVLIELDPTEAFPVQPVQEKEMYRLGLPVWDIVPGYVIAEATPVYWCPVQQEWRNYI